jgi:hypothetical protein
LEIPAKSPVFPSNLEAVPKTEVLEQPQLLKSGFDFLWFLG